MSNQPLSSDRPARLARALESLDGLSIGDAFGSQFFLQGVWDRCLHARATPTDRPPHPGEWRYTDDTEMALGILEVLEDHDDLPQDVLAAAFARRYRREMYRGYGPAAHGILESIGRGVPWQKAARSVFGGQGSLGNGGAMRVAPLGAYFADDLDRAIHEARKSAEVTHAHPEGVAGAIAVAVAAVWAAHHRGERANGALLDAVLEHTPEGRTQEGLETARGLGAGETVARASRLLGNGSQVTAPDTVPLCMWLADRHLDDYPESMWQTVNAFGDVDTTCAIVGGVVAAAASTTIPPEWRAAREPLDRRGGRP